MRTVQYTDLDGNLNVRTEKLRWSEEIAQQVKRPEHYELVMLREKIHDENEGITNYFQAMFPLAKIGKKELKGLDVELRYLLHRAAFDLIDKLPRAAEAAIRSAQATFLKLSHLYEQSDSNAQKKAEQANAA